MLSLRASRDRVFSDESIPVLKEEENRLETVGDKTGVGVFWQSRHTQIETIEKSDREWRCHKHDPSTLFIVGINLARITTRRSHYDVLVKQHLGFQMILHQIIIQNKLEVL
jgi:hypothetical protein